MACSSSEPTSPESWTHDFDGAEVQLTSSPTITSSTGGVGSQAWKTAVLTRYAEGKSSAIEIKLDGPGGMRLVVEIFGTGEAARFNGIAPGTNRALKRRSTIASSPGKSGDVSIGFRTDDKYEAASLSGAVRLEELKSEHDASTNQGTMSGSLVFEDVKVTTSLLYSSSSAAPPAEGSSEPIYTISGKLSLTGKDVPAPPAPAGGSPTGGSGDCATAWTCPNDGQATPMCKSACGYPKGSTQRSDTCKVLVSMLSSGNPSKCCPLCVSP